MFLATYIMSISLKLIQTVEQISKLINDEIYKDINKLINKNLNKTKIKFNLYIKKWIEEQPEIRSLNAGSTLNSLSALFGLKPDEATQCVKNIVDLIINNAVVDIKINSKLDGEIIFNFQRVDFSDLLSLQSGHRITNKNEDLHWLDWLLTKGNTIVIIGYYYKPSNTGRSGGGTMIKNGSFRIPPEFSGNLENNFITRAFQGREVEITKILQGLLD